MHKVKITNKEKNYASQHTESLSMVSMVVMASSTASASNGLIVSNSSCNLATSSAVDSNC